MKKAVIIITGIALAGIIALPLFAHGPGWGGKWGGSTYGGSHDCPHYGYQSSNLTQEQLSELDALRTEFRANTDKIRDQLIDKNYNLRSELRKTTPDEKKAMALQSDISELRAQMDSARIAHILKVKKVDPDAGAGYFGKGGRHAGADCYRDSRGMRQGRSF